MRPEKRDLLREAKQFWQNDVPGVRSGQSVLRGVDVAGLIDYH